MAGKLHFTLVSPERQLMSEQVDMVEAPGVDGLFGVLPNHAPFMTALASGIVRVRSGAEVTDIFVQGGFADVTPEGLTILAEDAVPVRDLEPSELTRRLGKAVE